MSDIEKIECVYGKYSICAHTHIISKTHEERIEDLEEAVRELRKKRGVK